VPRTVHAANVSVINKPSESRASVWIFAANTRMPSPAATIYPARRNESVAKCIPPGSLEIVIHPRCTSM
jgi:hypothetical protein